MLSGEDQIRIDTRMHEIKHGRKRKVISWELTGASVYRGRRLPGYVRLHLESGGWIWRPENTPLPDALAYARSLGFDTTEISAQIDHWVQTGRGATFKLL